MHLRPSFPAQSPNLRTSSRAAAIVAPVVEADSGVNARSRKIVRVAASVDPSPAVWAITRALCGKPGDGKTLFEL